MVQGLSLNQFAPNTPIAGMYVYQANLPQLHNVIVSASQSTPLSAGSIVTLDTSSTNKNAPVAKQAAVTDKVLGIVTYNPIKNQWGAGERIAVARDNDIVWLPTAGAITVGADLFFNSSNQVTSVQPAGGSKIGVALTPATAEDELIQVDLHFAEALSNYLTTSAAAETYQAKLTAGDNITISDNTISAADTTYTAGDFVSISENNVITTTYTAGDNIAISDEGAISYNAG